MNNPATTIPKLKIDDLEIPVPIIQGGMGVGISMSSLASAVANEGAVGVISAIELGVFEEDKKIRFREANKIVLEKEIDKARSMSNGILGINIMEAITDRDALLQLAVDKEIDIVFLGAGLPLKNIPEKGLVGKRTKFVPIVSSARAALLIFKYWDKNYGRCPDALIIEGPLAGGHLGYKEEQINDPHFSLENILAATIPVIKPFEDKYGKKFPIIVAGGIYTGADIYKFMQLGAGGVQMGTRFVATTECDADEAFKQAYINCKKEDIVIIKSPLGLPGRVIKNKFVEDVMEGMKKPFKCAWKCLKTCNFKTTPYCILAALYSAKMGNLKEGFAFAGANAYRINKIISVKELIEILLNEYQLAASIS
jgi:NAD(P)H-dependent flavin oxidoreductase YrpB (nitropropane dioxygenase family)